LPEGEPTGDEADFASQRTRGAPDCAGTASVVRYKAKATSGCAVAGRIIGLNG
jgi:hypothetical protein